MSKTTRELREYLTGFLSDFDYVEKARSALLSAFDRVFADEENLRLYEEARARFEKDPNEKFKYLVEVSDRIAAETTIHPYTLSLLLLILLSESSKQVYAELGLPLKMWHDNMLDLKYVCDTCILLYGVYGTYCTEWAKGFFAATRITFGKLQFERDRLGKTYHRGEISLLPDDRVIFIHLPRTGERLLPSDVDEACAAASAFFRERDGIDDVIFACHSWLLYPKNKSILSEKSNLYSFISRFDIIDVQEDTEYKELWRLFDRVYRGNADELPQDTSLRRAYAEIVKAHEPLGVALGVWVYRP